MSFIPNQYMAYRTLKDGHRYRVIRSEEAATGEVSVVLHVYCILPQEKRSVEASRMCLVPAGGTCDSDSPVPLVQASSSIIDKASETTEAAKFVSLPMNPSTGSARALEAARGWLSHCRLNHERCNRPQRVEESFYPTRLIDLGEPGSLNWKLCVVAEDGLSHESASYITLSYRWAPNPQLMLTRSNMADLRRGSAIRDLPRLFRNVAAVARLFDIRYLWIDALCIIQDSKEDWELEARSMQHVYANSACTISASASRGPHESLFRRRDPQTLRPSFVESSLFQVREYPHHMLSARYWDQEIDGPLHGRGWVYQERFLSPRVLHFGTRQVLWECHTEQKSEVFPLGIPMHHSDKDVDALWNNTQQRLEGSLMSVRTYNLWQRLVSAYTACKFTEASDRLMAFAGIARLFEEVTGDQYVQGMWKSCLVSMLDWQVETPRPRPENRLAPSYSWTAIDGVVQTVDIYGDEAIPLIQVSWQNISDDAPFGVRVQGRLLPIKCVARRTGVHQTQACVPVPHLDILNGLITWDTTDLGDRDDMNLDCLPAKLRALGFGGEFRSRSNGYACYGLVLRRETRKGGDGDHYRRVGLIQFDSWSTGESPLDKITEREMKSFILI